MHRNMMTYPIQCVQQRPMEMVEHHIAFAINHMDSHQFDLFHELPDIVLGYMSAHIHRVPVTLSFSLTSLCDSPATFIVLNMWINPSSGVCWYTCLLWFSDKWSPRSSVTISVIDLLSASPHARVHITYCNGNHESCTFQMCAGMHDIHVNLFTYFAGIWKCKK